ncbi:ArsR/SmtB family transcription factor [Lentzea cavernae]|uniref:Transcriptional regulator n=1 Tax=Lentzea cavernae TaxID=2020703 RepID=A0ABQ3MGB9_9PSEU|nr:winged helix-turn-helix domain-containing protein [Lentzea cavernae]GHH37094.1 transcriptional regulator [Lentzea cavernae]
MEALAQVAGLLADSTRAAICGALLDGRAWTARELAAHAGVAASTASEHLTRLVEGGLLVEHRQGRHRYVALAGPHVAELLEAMAAFAGPRVPPRGLRAAAVSEAMARGRTCYDHLAGRLGVALKVGLVAAGVLRTGTAGVGNGDLATADLAASDLTITEPGMVWLKELGFEPGNRRLTRPCLDWTERVPHLAGAAGAFLCEVFLDRGWIRRIGTSRAVLLTPEGEQAWKDLGLT